MKTIISICFMATLVFLGACQPNHQAKAAYPKNIILLIGDGMGPQQIGLLESYARLAPESIYRDKSNSTDNKKNATALSRFANQGRVSLAFTHPYGALVADSACAATQLATGQPSRSEMIGLDVNGNSAIILLEYAKQKNKSTGLVSDTRITHATPAAFATHLAHRSMENEIAQQLIESGNVDVMLSGGLRYFLPKDAESFVDSDPLLKSLQIRSIDLKSKREDSLNLLNLAQQQGYALLFDKNELQSNESNRLLGLFASSAMQDATEARWEKREQEPSLKDMTLKALETLSRNPQGFVLMVEAGQIDWAAHNNDAGRLLHEMLRFDETIEAVFQWVKERDDTLIIITADHETGGFGFSYSGASIPDEIPLQGSAFSERMFAPNFNFGSLELLDRLFLQKKSFMSIWKEASAGKAFPEAEALMQSINSNMQFKLSLAETQTILHRETNPFKHEGHKYLSASEIPKVNDFKAFYVYGDEVHLNLIGRALAQQQNVVWATGTHTSTPVTVISWGPGKDSIAGMQTQAELGQKMREMLH